MGTKLYHPRRLNTATTTVLKTGRGVIGKINVHNAGATGNRVEVFDNTSATGTPFIDMNPPTVQEHEYTAHYKTGLTVRLSGTTPPDITISFS